MVNARARRNLLTKVRINGVILTDDEEIKVRVCKAYQTLFSKTRDWRSNIRDLHFEVLEKDKSRSLEVLF